MLGAERAAERRRSSVRKATIALLLGAVLVAPAGRARADEPVLTTTGSPSATRQAAAEALFVEAKRLIEEKSYARACAKLAESERLDPAAGTLLNLADCYEKNGQLASAWVTFREAATASARDGSEAWAKQASSRAQLLDSRLLTLTIDADPARARDGLEIWRDGAMVAPSAWGSALPLDPSTSRIEVRAPNKRPWVTSVTLDERHPHEVVSVPPLDDLAPPPPARPAEPPRPSIQKPVSFAIGAAGLLGLGVGGALGIVAITKNNQAASRCPQSDQCADADALTLTHDAKTAATGSTIAFSAGGVFLAAAAVLFFTAPSALTSMSVRPQLSLDHGTWSASVAGRF